MRCSFPGAACFLNNRDDFYERMLDHVMTFNLSAVAFNYLPISPLLHILKAACNFTDLCFAFSVNTSNYYLSLFASSLSVSSCPDLSIKTVPGAAVVSVAVGSPAAAVAVQPGERAS